jgi:hypothetical protein
MSRHLLIPFVLLALAATLLADVPRTISYQGRLTDNGVPVNGLKSVRFKIYDRSSNPIWNSGSVSVTFTDGLFTVELGQSPQPSLPVDIWPSDTAMSLGVTIAPNPELSPRLKFKTVPYAMHALTAESANSGGGWLHKGGHILLEDSTELVGIGTSTPYAKVGISALGDQLGLWINSSSNSVFIPAMEVRSETVTGAIFRLQGQEDSLWYPAGPFPAVYAISTNENGMAGSFRGESNEWPTLSVHATAKGSGIGTFCPNGYGLYVGDGKGIRARVDSATAITAESYCSDRLATVLSSAYTGSALYDHIAISGYSRPADFYGIGGEFEGGFIGVEGKVLATGANTYAGVRGTVEGGSGVSYGVLGRAMGNYINYAVYGNAYNGVQNWAGYFAGDVRVVGSLVNSKSTLSIDHPTDPDNEFLQQAEVVSDNLSAIYSGNVTLDGNGSAVVQLPDYLESFCGDFRYQLTCVGGYAPVYVSSEITGNQFTIAGGKAGLKVSWQITGIRKDKYAQANPLEVEKKKTASEQGKYLHPELYGRSADRSLSPNPDRDASVKGKNDAIRAATAALAKPSTPPKQPVMMEKK